MRKNGFYKKIIELVKEEPSSQREIWIKLDKRISKQAVAKHLRRGIKKGELLYLGSKPKSDAKFLLREYFINRFGDKLNKSWPTNARRYYIHLPHTSRFYKRLRRNKIKNKVIVAEFIELYRVLELSAMYQKVMYENINVLRLDFRSRDYDFKDEEIQERIIKTQKGVDDFYETRDKNDPILNLLQLTPLMYWLAFSRPVPVDHLEYNPSNDIVKNFTEPFLEKLKLHTKI